MITKGTRLNRIEKAVQSLHETIEHLAGDLPEFEYVVTPGQISRISKIKRELAEEAKQIRIEIAVREVLR